MRKWEQKSKKKDRGKKMMKRNRTVNHYWIKN